MKQRLFLSLLIALGITNVLSAQKINPVITNYSFKFKVVGLMDVDVFLGHHYGDKKMIRDTAHVNSKGEVEFTGTDTLIGGIYLFIPPDRRNYFEFVVNETKIQMETDTLDMVGHMVVKKSAENTVWYSYMKQIMQMQKEVTPWVDITKKPGLDSSEYKKAKEEIAKITDKVNKFREDQMKKSPDMLVSVIFRAMKDPDMSKAPRKANGDMDTVEYARYFKNHFWDNFDLSDNRIIRTPVLESKMVYFFEKLLPQIPDTVIPEVDRVLAATMGDKEMMKFFLHHLLYNFERSPVMCMDAVFVHMVEKYYKTKQAFWIDQKSLEKIVERADKLKPLLCGSVVN